MKIKIPLFALLLFTATLVFAQSNDLKTMLDSLLETNPDYQQAVSRYKYEKALFTIEQSNNWFDVNLKYQQYDNDFTRDETEIVLEHSDVNEKDKRKSIELQKQLFPKDSDNVKNAIGSRLDLLYYKHDMILTRSKAMADILDDMIMWFEASRKESLTQSRLDILYQQNRILEELDEENQIDPEILIQNLEDIDKREDDLYDYKTQNSILEKRYGTILPDFLQNMEGFISLQIQADTLEFERLAARETRELNKEIKNLSRRIKLNYLYFYLPEINLSLSYNWRDTKQTWDIEKNNIFRRMIRNQKEEFPQGEIEISLPFNLFSNTAGKAGLLSSYARELDYRSTQLNTAWKNFTVESLNSYRSARLENKRKTRLKELYERNLDIQNRKFREEPSLLGSNPELRLQKETIRTTEAQVESKISEMKLYKEIYLINSLGDEIK